MTIEFKKNKLFYILLILTIGYFALQMFLALDLAINSDEGTHLITGLFYKDLIYNLKNFHSINDAAEFIINYIAKYSKVTPYYPPLYYLLLVAAFVIKENLIIGRILSILVTILSSYVIYELSYEFFGNKKISFLSLVFFLSFSIIFFYANKVMLDILQLLTFSCVLWYYVKLKKVMVRNLHLKDLLILSVLVALSLLTKFYSIFIPIVILLDSFLYDKKFFKKMFIALIISAVIVSPYAFLFYKFQMHKLVIGKAMTPWRTPEVIFDIFTNFGVFLGVYAVFSLIYFFYKNRKNYIFFIWFFIPLIGLLYLKNYEPRYAFILMPIYSMSCAFTFVEIKKLFRSGLKKDFLVLFISCLIILQMIHNVFINSQGPVYPIDDIMKAAKKDGNILLLSENPVFSSVFMFYGRLDETPGSIIRSCVFFEGNLTKDFLHEWGIKYIIDQENTLNESSINSLNLKIVLEKEVVGGSFKLFELQEDVDKKDCNYVCILLGKVCKGMKFSEIAPMINKNIYVTLSGWS